MSCEHPFHHDHQPCPHPAAPGRERCVWHDRSVAKGDPYVAILLEGVIARCGDDLVEFHLAGLRWRKAQLAGADLRGVDLRDADLAEADLRNAHLEGAVLRHTNLRGARLGGAHLRHADLTATQLTAADLSEADLSRAILDHTDLRGADLTACNLAGARLERFLWNRSTCFMDVRGLEAQGPADEEAVTQPYVSAMAVQQEQARRHSSDLFTVDERETTHVYRQPSGEVDAPSEPALEPHDYTPQNNRVLPSNPSPWYRVLLAAAVLIAVGASALASWAVGEMQTRSQLQSPTDGAVAQERPSGILPPEIDSPDAPDSADQSAMIAALRRQHQEEEQRLQDRLSQASDLISELRSGMYSHQQELEAVQADRDGLRLELARYRLASDHQATATSELAALQRAHNRLVSDNRRLRDTSAIMAQGVERLRQENQTLKSERKERLTHAYDVRQLQDEADSLRKAKSELEQRLQASEERSQSLATALTRARETMDRFLARVQGSQFYAYLTGSENEGTTYDLIPGKTLLLGGEYLITLEVEPTADQDNAFTSTLVVQRPPHTSISDVTLVFLGPQDQVLRSITYSFPQVDSDQSFVSASSTLQVDTQPTRVRVLVSPAADAELLTAAR